MKLADAEYFSLATFRKNGNAVPTPVWFAAAGDTFYVFSASNAGKVKRIRLTSRARIAVCDVRGKLLGEWIEARARLVSDAEEIRTAYASLHAKYRLKMLIGDFFAKLSGRFDRRQFIAVTLAP
jgi:PPOX class probable F420-dependent enzyme